MWNRDYERGKQDLMKYETKSTPRTTRPARNPCPNAAGMSWIPNRARMATSPRNTNRKTV